MSKLISTLKSGELFLHPPVPYDYNIIEGIVTEQCMTSDGEPFTQWRFLDAHNNSLEMARGHPEVSTFSEFKDVVNNAFYEGT